MGERRVGGHSSSSSWLTVGVIDSRLKDVLVLGETRDVPPTRDIHVDADARALGVQLCHILTMVCQEGAQKMF